jgi:hypothetical protein
MFSDLFHFFVKKRKFTSYGSNPVRLIRVGLLLLTLIALVAACNNGSINENTPTPEIPPTTTLTGPIRENPTPLGQQLIAQDQDTFADIIDISAPNLSSSVILTSSHGLLINYIQTPAEDFPEEGALDLENSSGGTLSEELVAQISDFGLIGAVTTNLVTDTVTGGNIIGVLYVNESVVEEPFQAGMHLVILHDSLEDPLPEEPNIEIRYIEGEIDGEPFTPDGVVLEDREIFELGSKASVFQFTVGSHRCHVCPWFLSSCICFNCPHW